MVLGGGWLAGGDRGLAVCAVADRHGGVCEPWAAAFGAVSQAAYQGQGAVDAILSGDLKLCARSRDCDAGAVAALPQLGRVACA